MAKGKLGHEPRPRWATAANGQKRFGKIKRRRQLRGNWNEGVGEHVRTRFHLGALDPREIAELKRSAPSEETDASSAGPVSKERTLLKYDPAVRPDVSPTPSFVDQSPDWICLLEADRLKALVTCRHQAAGNPLRRDLLLLLRDLAGLLRSLLHCALRLLCLLSFLRHVALQCSEMALFAACTRESKCTTSEYTNTSKKTASRLRKC
jgi:hypothetical protein